MQADFLLDYDVITVEREQTLYLMARLTAGAAPGQEARRPLNLSLIIDRSGSMAGSKIDYTRQAAALLVENLSQTDTFSVVLYNEGVETFLQPQQVTHKDLLKQRLQKIRAGGTTNLSGGWLEGISHVADNLDPDQINRVILMSDGLANRGIVDQAELVKIAAQKREEGVSTTTMGLGEDFNEDLLIEIADAGGGAFYFIESPEVTPGIFQEELSGLLKLVGQNLTLTVLPTVHVQQVRQMNTYPEESHPDGQRYRMGDIHGDDTRSVMLEMKIPALDTIGQVQIATLRFEYDELQDNTFSRKSIELPVHVNVAAQVDADSEQNAEVTRSVLLLKAADARREAIKLADSGKFKEAADLLRSTADAIQVAGLDDPALKDEYNALMTQAKDMTKGAEYYKSYSRKSISTQVYLTGKGAHEDTRAFRLRQQQRQADQEPKDDASSGTGKLPHPNSLPSDENKKNKPHETYTFENPLSGSSEPSRPTSDLPPTHLRWGDQLFPLNQDLIRLGRAPQNEIVINASGISRFHAQIRQGSGRVTIEDLDSTNGTHINGGPIHQPYTVREGDTVYLCDQKIRFERH